MSKSNKPAIQHELALSTEQAAAMGRCMEAVGEGTIAKKLEQWPASGCRPMWAEELRAMTHAIDFALEEGINVPLLPELKSSVRACVQSAHRAGDEVATVTIKEVIEREHEEKVRRLTFNIYSETDYAPHQGDEVPPAPEWEDGEEE